MSSHFVKVMRQAFHTFDRKNQATFNANFQILKALTDQLTYSDIQLSPHQLLCYANASEQLDKAPCTFVNIFENDIVSMSVFVMRAGYTMPLHDHPLMHGILRGIYGQLRVQSYTQKLSPTEPLVYERGVREVCVTAEEPRIVGPETESAILSPTERNYHEITALDGVAAFFDILSPPYDADIPIHGTRRCRFYRAATPEVAQEPMVRLERIPAPLSYFCDIAEPSNEVKLCSAHFHLLRPKPREFGYEQ